MRKKLLIFFIVVLIALLSVSLIACDKDITNFNGNVTVNITLDREYDNLTVECPEGKIEKISNLKYIVMLENLLPIDILVCAPGYENVALRYSTEKLKANSNINESVSLKQELYRFTFSMESQSVKLAESYDGINLVVQASQYVLESIRPITQDIKLDCGDGLKTAILFKEVFVYTGTKGKLSEKLPMVEIGSDKVAIFVVRTNLNQDYLYINDIESTNSSSIYVSKYNLVDIKNYQIYDYYQKNKKLVKKSDLQQGYYRFDGLYTKGATYAVFLEEDNYITDIYADFFVEERRQDNATYLATNRVLEVGDTFIYTYGNNNTYGAETRYHIVTAEETQTYNFNLENDRKISDFDGRKFVFNITDANGNTIQDAKITADYEDIDGKQFEFDSERMYHYYIDVQHPTINYQSRVVQLRVIAYYIANSKQDVAVVDFVIYSQEMVEIDYKDYVTGEIIEGLGKYLYVVEGDYIYDLSPSDSSYSVIGSQQVIYYKEIFGNTIVVNIIKNYNIKLNITNYSEFKDDMEYGQFKVANCEISFGKSSIDEYGNVDLVIPANFIGDVLQFSFMTYSGEVKYTFFLDLTGDINNGDTFEVTILSTDDEW